MATHEMFPVAGVLAVVLFISHLWYPWMEIQSQIFWHSKSISGNVLSAFLPDPATVLFSSITNTKSLVLRSNFGTYIYKTRLFYLGFIVQKLFPFVVSQSPAALFSVT
jgi:hypothetical protein